MTYFVGIDTASASFVAAVFTHPGGPAHGPKSFSNDSEGFAAFLDWLQEKHIPKEDTFLCLENTGVYSEALCYTLDQAGFTLALLHPRAVWKAFDDPRKSDERDSQKIAEYGYRYRDRLEPWHPQEAVVEQIRTLLSTREQLVEQKTAMQNTRQALRRKVIQTPTANEALHTTIDHFKAQIQAIERAIRDLIEAHPTMAQMVALLVSAPGVGLLLAAHMLVLTEGFSKTPRYRKLASYLGICPHKDQSGTWQPTPRSRGYGPPMVRKLLHLAARSVRTHEKRFRRYFHRKQAEGKDTMLILNNIANKLLRMLCSMIRNKQPYIADYQSVHPRLLQTGTRS